MSNMSFGTKEFSVNYVHKWVINKNIFWLLGTKLYILVHIIKT